MTNLHVILGDQLSTEISSLKNFDKKKGVVLMCEVMNEAQYVKHHKKKLIFIFAAMRHFALHLSEEGFKVKYIKLDDKNNSGSIKGEVEKALKDFNINQIIITHPGEYRVLQDIISWRKSFNKEVNILEDDRFLCSTYEFKLWAKDRKKLRMEDFYHKMRVKHNILVNEGKPVGGKWNFDSENRSPAKDNLKFPKYKEYDDPILNKVKLMVAENSNFHEHFGDIEPFYLALNREQALEHLQQFISKSLPYFGMYQDAMLTDEPFMFHSCLSFYLNTGLLNPMECIDAAIKAFENNSAPINSVEGFIRQILGWREYVRGVYWYKMPEYKALNYFNANKKLPNLYWTGETKLNCLKQCINDVKKYAYSHHIQRLMILANFANLIGVAPEEINEWYMIVYADAFEWVELPNVSGMALFADGGLLASKPYISGGAYINKMSNYCQRCKYNIKEKTGENACPFNYLYWNFLIKHQEKLKNNQRLKMIYSTLNKMDNQKITDITDSAKNFVDGFYNKTTR